MWLSSPGETQPTECSVLMQAHPAMPEVARRAEFALAWRHARAALLELNLMLEALREAGADPNMRSDIKMMAVDLAWLAGKIGVARGEGVSPGRRDDE